MPHLTVEITSNLESFLVPDALLDRAHQAVLSSGVFDGPDVKSRLARRDAFRIGHGGMEEAFMHASLDLLAGRTEEMRGKLSDAVVDALVKSLPHNIGFAVQVSCDVRDINRGCYAKAIHTE